MSSDNGIYILQMKDQSRVIHAQAIDNLHWSFISFQQEPNIVVTRVVEFFNDARPMTLEEAQNEAAFMERDILESEVPLLEYGVSTINLSLITWADLVDHAKAIAAEEIRVIREHADTRWDSDLAYLEQLFQ